MRVLDSHVHFFDATRSDGIEWPAKDSPIYGVVLPENRTSLTSDYCLAGVVAVETSRRPVDDQWLLRLAGSEPIIAGVVLNLQPDQPGFHSRLERACESPGFLGIRLRPIRLYDLSSQLLREHFGLLAKQSRSVELGAPEHTDKLSFAELASAFPNITWILDHAGHPGSASLSDAQWLEDMRRIAALPNTVTKVTVFGGDLNGWRSIMEVLLAMFGVHRVLYGSNWPVSDVDPVTSHAAFLGEAAQAFFYDNACATYGIRSL
jgi:predicted TIM-barrel fold metal-dependent hydrolase